MANKTKVYILSAEMRVNQSPFYLEGDRHSPPLQYDIPDEYPIPLENTIVEEGVPKELRCMMNSRFVEKQSQIQEEKRPIDWEPSDAERSLLTFKFGRLVDDGKNKVVTEYLDRVGWNAKNVKTRGPNTKVIFEEYDEDAIVDAELAKEELSFTAMKAIMSLDAAQTENLYLASMPGSSISPDFGPNKMKKHLVNIAKVNPEFIINGVGGEKQKATILVHKAINFKLISLEFPTMVAMVDVSNPAEWKPILEINEAGGPEGKFDRFVDYLLTIEGKPQLAVIKGLVDEKEADVMAKA